MKQSLFLFLLIPVLANAQKSSMSTLDVNKDHAVQWVTGLTWRQILDKAKEENKYILVDCFATWCVPCKRMDEEVYTNDSVAQYMNANYILVKIQLDTSKSDDTDTRNFYEDAHTISKKYMVDAYPTFLFLTPDGELVHKDEGYKNPKYFMSTMKNGLNPKRQYFTLAADYKQGKRDYSVMAYLAGMANLFNDTSFANKVADDYISNYLLRLKADNLFAEKNIQFLIGFTRTPADKGFEFLYKNAGKVNKIMKDDNFIQPLIHYVISRAEIDPEVASASKSSSKTPEWEVLYKRIAEKYDNYYAERTILDAKIRWYLYKKQWAKFAKNTVDYVDKYLIKYAYTNIGVQFDLAWKSFSIFEVSLDKNELQRALAWSELVLRSNKDSSNVLPNAMDTYANILHKINYLFENVKSNNLAISTEKRAIAIMSLKSENKPKIELMRQTLEKMQKGEPTWSVFDEEKEGKK